VAAAERHNVFQSAWFGDPITFGDYPALMRELVGSRLPVFTEEQKRRLKGSYDFLGLNHYSTKYYSPAPPSPHTDTEEGDSSSSSSRALFDSSGDSATAGWFADQSVVESPRDSAGSSAGPQAASPWLQVVPNGFKDAILWNTHRYTTQVDGTPLIIITENGCDVPGEGQGQGEWGSEPLAQVLHDEFRIAYYDGYLQALQQAREQGATVGGYFAWSLLDNFEWADGYSYRFGLTFVDYTSPSRTRIPKASSHWYRDYVKAHSASNGGFENYHGRRYRRSYGSSDNSDSGDNKGEGGGWWRFITSALEYHHGSMPTLADL
jgi:beta-glucosidase